MAYVLILSNCPHERCAEDIAEALLEQRLAGAVNIVPGVRSWYHWEGNIERTQELLLVIKARAERYPDIERVIIARHPYATPGIVSVKIAGGSPAYLAWLSGAAPD